MESRRVFFVAHMYCFEVLASYIGHALTYRPQLVTQCTSTPLQGYFWLWFQVLFPPLLTTFKLLSNIWSNLTNVFHMDWNHQLVNWIIPIATFCRRECHGQKTYQLESVTYFSQEVCSISFKHSGDTSHMCQGISTPLLLGIVISSHLQ